MKDVNFVALAGRLGTDPKVHVFDDGNRMLGMSVATSRGSAENKRTEWTRVNYRVYAEKEFEFLKRHLVEGTAIHITGTLRNFTKSQENGQTTKITFVQADSLTILTFREDGQSDTDDEMDPEDAAMAAMYDPQPTPAAPTPPVQRPARGRDAPAVAPQPKAQSVAAPGIALTPAGNGEVTF